MDGMSCGWMEVKALLLDDLAAAASASESDSSERAMEVEAGIRSEERVKQG